MSAGQHPGVCTGCGRSLAGRVFVEEMNGRNQCLGCATGSPTAREGEAVLSAPDTSLSLGGGEPGGAGTPTVTLFGGGNPFRGPWRRTGRGYMPLKVRVVDREDVAVAYVHPSVEELVARAPALLAAAELAIETGEMAGLCTVVALIRAGETRDG